MAVNGEFIRSGDLAFKTCSACGERLPLDRFARQTRTTSRAARCRDCAKAAARAAKEAKRAALGVALCQQCNQMLPPEDFPRLPDGERSARCAFCTDGRKRSRRREPAGMTEEQRAALIKAATDWRAMRPEPAPVRYCCDGFGSGAHDLACPARRAAEGRQ